MSSARRCGPWSGGVMVSWCQRQVPPLAGGSCPRSQPGQSGTITQQVQHPVRRSANPLPFPRTVVVHATRHGQLQGQPHRRAPIQVPVHTGPPMYSLLRKVQVGGGGKFSTGNFLPGKIPPGKNSATIVKSDWKNCATHVVYCSYAFLSMKACRAGNKEGNVARCQDRRAAGFALGFATDFAAG